MKKLLKSNDVSCIEEYYELIANSVLNGQRGQAVEYYKDMPVKYRKHFISLLLETDEFDSRIDCADKQRFIWA